jgi:hypothetical protein
MLDAIEVWALSIEVWALSIEVWALSIEVWALWDVEAFSLSTFAHVDLRAILVSITQVRSD